MIQPQSTTLVTVDGLVKMVNVAVRRFRRLAI